VEEKNGRDEDEEANFPMDVRLLLQRARDAKILVDKYSALQVS